MSHSLRGTMVTCVTWDVPLQELKLRRDAMGMRCPRRQTFKSLPSVEEHKVGGARVPKEYGIAYTWVLVLEDS